MRILQIVPQMKMGGVETGTLDLACELARLGHQSYVVSAGGPLVEVLERSGVKHILLPVHKKSLWTIWRMKKALRTIILREKIEIVHARSRVPAWIARGAVQGTKARFLTTAHGYYRSHWGSSVMGTGERVIAVSEVIRDHLVQNFRVHPDRVRLIHRGVDLKKFPYHAKTFNTKAPIIGIIGRITPLKGHEYFIRAFAEIVKTFPEAKGLIVGNASRSKKSYYNELIKLSRELGLEKNIEFLPGTSEISEMMKRLDLLVLTTTVPEAFGRVVIEAQALGVPVVATRVGGVVDIIEDGKTGWLIPPLDSAALSKKVLEIFSGSANFNELAKEARLRVEAKFNLDLMVKKTLAVYQELLRSPKILVIKWSALGDIVLATPTLRALRRAFPESEISVLIQKSYEDLLKNCPYIDCQIAFEKEAFSNYRGFWRMVRELKSRRFDILLDLQNNKKSHFLGFFGRIPLRVGYRRGGRGFLLTRSLEYKKDAGPVQSQERLLNLLGLSMENKDLELWPSEAETQRVESLLDGSGIIPGASLVALFPFSSQRWESKRWKLKNFIELANLLGRECGAIPVFIGGKDDQSFSAILKGKIKVPYLDFIGQTNLNELFFLLKKCRVLVSGDSAPLHLASAAGLPTIALFGPTDPARHAPPGRVEVMTHPVSCAPCYLPECKIKTHDCLDLVTVEDVLNKIKQLLNSK